jgi:multimeric flavodoxin WrbA
MAKAVYDGALSSGAMVIMKKVEDATSNDLLDCDTVIFGTPTNFGYMSGIMKEFFDQAWLGIGDKVANKRYCAFTSAGSGAKQALESIDRICNTFNERKQFKFIKCLEGIAANLKPSPEVLEQCRSLGREMAQL